MLGLTFSMPLLASVVNANARKRRELRAVSGGVLGAQRTTMPPPQVVRFSLWTSVH